MNGEVKGVIKKMERTPAAPPLVVRSGGRSLRVSWVQSKSAGMLLRHPRGATCISCSYRLCYKEWGEGYFFIFIYI